MRTYIMFLLYFATQLLVLSTTVALALSLSSVTDKRALLSLKVKLTNGEYDYLPSWNESLHFCEWEGVTCGRRHMRVVVLQLENQNLGGTLEPALGNLTFLRKLKLSNINLHGEIPSEIGLLKRLQVLHLSKNNLHGKIPNFTNCTNLHEIILSHNQLTGNIPSWFGSMIHLNKLILGANNLVGSIPPSLGNISSLQNITLARNQLQGNIPYSLGRLSSLKEFNLGSNNFSGEIPRSLYNLSNIQVFVLGENQLFGSLPSNIHLVFPNLLAFLVGGNHIVGTFPCSISNLTELRRFDISWNGFNGLIPKTLGSLKKLQIFHIGNNNFGSGGVHDLDFLSSLTNCTQLQELILDNNKFGGELPDCIGNFSANLTWLSMASNQIFGRLPERVGQLIGLTELNMEKNFLEGTIPNSIGMLKNIVILVLQENKLFGNIPNVIGNLTVLSGLYLHTNTFEGSIPITFKYCTTLQSFGVSDNNLSGDIPDQTFGYMEGLINLDLSNNSLTGSIPSDFGNLKHLSILYLDENKFSGEIPNELASCLTLIELMLQRNFFRGSIPSFLGSSLRSLEILDLSSNNFSSIIPFELENLTFLNKLDLSFNNLYGEVPIGGVFSNVTAISLTGNKNLCGGIPQLKLSPCFREPSKKYKRSLKQKPILISVIGGILISSVAFIILHFLTRKPKRLPSSPSLKNRLFRVTYRELHEATNGFSLSNLIGSGSFSSIYKGSLVNFESPIVVKVLNLHIHGATKCFMAECKALGKMKHRNLVKILTCCSSIDYNGEDFKAIVFEYMPNGSLEKLLHENDGFGNHNLNLTQRVDIALDVARALDYLHNDTEQVVVHCDIKPSNVLLDDDIVAHLGDFGIARLIDGGIGHSSNDQVTSSTIIKGTIGYVPPEYGARGQVSPEGDIYSYGILLLEMLTGKRPTNNMFNENLNLHEYCKMKIPEGILDIVESHLVLPFVDDQTGIVENKIRQCLVIFAGIGVACSEEFPAHRMLIKDVIVKLNEIKSKFPS